MKMQTITVFSLIAFMAIAQAADQPGSVVGPPEGKCGKYSSQHRYISKNTDMTSLFFAAAESAGYGNGTLIPESFRNQKEADYCYTYVDPPGFPHHISDGRACSLTISGSPVGLTVKLKHSGCYLKSSRRHLNRHTAASPDPATR